MRDSALIEIIGHVGKDPSSPSPEKYPDFVTFEVAVSTSKKDVNWFKCQTSSEGLAKVVKSYVKKGDGVLIRGYPKVNAYIGKDGKAKAQFEININYINLLTSNKEKPSNTEISRENYITEVEELSKLNDEIPF
jgi:single-stranded DNA-binding protein